MTDGAVSAGDAAEDGGLLGALLAALPETAAQHAPAGRLHALLSRVARAEATRLFGPEAPGTGTLGPFGSIVFPTTRWAPPRRSSCSGSTS